MSKEKFSMHGDIEERVAEVKLCHPIGRAGHDTFVEFSDRDSPTFWKEYRDTIAISVIFKNEKY